MRPEAALLHLRRMFRTSRRQLELLERVAASLESLEGAVHALHTAPATDDELAKRVASLELAFERRAAEAEGLLLQAKGKLDATRAAEERARRLAESARRDEDGDEEGELLEQLAAAYQAQGGGGVDAGAGGDEGVHPLQLRLGARAQAKAAAIAAKWGGR